jgi:hypothetical protein
MEVISFNGEFNPVGEDLYNITAIEPIDFK